MTEDIRLETNAAPETFLVEMATGGSPVGTQWKVPGLPGATAPAIGRHHTVALADDGTVWVLGAY